MCNTRQSSYGIGKLQRCTHGGFLIVQFEVQDFRNPQWISKFRFGTSDHDAVHFWHTTEFGFASGSQIFSLLPA